jgi:hypothetical protein
MSNDQKPLKPDDFPVMSRAKKSRSKTAHLSQTPTIRPSLPTLPNASTRRKPDAKKISGQPKISFRVGGP